MVQKNARLWEFLSKEEQMLFDDGTFLLENSAAHPNPEPTDYSYLVFPFAKLYEGFLKDYFLSLGFISRRDYQSNHFRIGKVLSPNLVRRLRERSAYGKVRAKFGIDLADKLWVAWKEGRNRVFHYFPHDYRTLTRKEAEDRIQLMVNAMGEAITRKT